MAKKLTEILKKRILEGFCSGKSLTILSKEFGCTPSTITRAVKSFLTEDEYLKFLKGRKGKVRSLKKDTSSKSQELEKDALENSSAFNHLSKISKDHGVLEKEIASQDLLNGSGEFMEIAPLTLDPFCDEQKEVACVPLENNSLPPTVYMLIDKRTELEFKPLKDFPEWSFLSEKDQSRLAICLYSSQRVAKKNCSRNQRVLKVPNSNVFLISSSYLLAKGITRLIIDESLIALDK